MIRLGLIDYLNCLPVNLGLEKMPLGLKKGIPTEVNAWFANGEIDATAASSIVYGQNPEGSLILPGACVASDGAVGSIVLFSKGPIWQLDGKKVALPTTSATSVALLQILLEHHYKVKVAYQTTTPNLEGMLANADGALLIGDDTLLADPARLHCTDLGEAWKEFTGEAFVYALWLLRKDFAAQAPKEAEAFVQAVTAAREYSFSHMEELLAEASRRCPIPREKLVRYFSLLRHELGPRERRGLALFYRWCGLNPPFYLWGENRAETF